MAYYNVNSRVVKIATDPKDRFTQFDQTQQALIG